MLLVIHRFVLRPNSVLKMTEIKQAPLLFGEIYSIVSLKRKGMHDFVLNTYVHGDNVYNYNMFSAIVIRFNAP